MNRPLILLAAAAIALAGCGKVGELERPAPLWGAKAKADYEAQQRAAADANTRHRETPSANSSPAEGATSSTGGATQGNTYDPSPSRTQPIGGMRPDPSGSQPGGVLPDPYARPQ